MPGPVPVPVSVPRSPDLKCTTHICNHICSHICSHICNHICNHIIAELLVQVRFGAASSQILVGHSHFFRELCRKFRAPHCVLLDAAGEALPVDQLDSKKLSNAGVAKCTLDFGSRCGT